MKLKPFRTDDAARSDSDVLRRFGVFTRRTRAVRIKLSRSSWWIWSEIWKL